MKNLFLIILTLFVFNFCVADVSAEELQNVQSSQPILLKAETSFDWLLISQEEREQIIANYKNIIFGEDTVYKYKRKDFKNLYKSALKDFDYLTHYIQAQDGVTETRDYNLSAFYSGKTLIIYAIQYKNNLKSVYYYDAFGHLRYVDVLSDNYPNFPYWSMQYSVSGKMVSAIYFVAHDMQYMYKPNGDFQGVWFKDKMYDKNAKQTLTRTNW